MAGGRRCRFWIVTCLLYLAVPTLVVGDAGARALERQYLFETLANEEGLAQNTVNALLQDSHGFVWIATQGGLHRFDGQELRVWQQRPDDPDSLPDSFVTGLTEDPSGWLWVGSHSGAIAHLDLASGRVKVQQTAFEDIEPAPREVTAFVFEQGVGLWIGDRAGVLLLPEGEDIARRVADFSHPEAADAGRVLALAPSASGGVLAASSGGLWRVTADGHARRLAGSARRGFSSLLVTRDGTTYAGGRDGVFRVEGEHLDPVDLGDLQSPPAALAEDSDGRLWVGLFGHGLLRLDSDGQRLHLRHDRYVPGSLHEDHLTALMVDRSGLLWVGGFARGVARTLAGGTAFTWLADRGGTGQPLLGNNVRAAAEDASGALWLGLEGEGLKRLRPDRVRFDDFSPILRSALQLAADDSLRIQALAVDRHGHIWAGSTFGLARLDPAQGLASSVAVDPQSDDALPDADVRSLLHAEDGSLWIGGFRGGLSRMWPEGRRWAHYRHDPDDPATLTSDTVLALLQEPSGALWVGTLDGLNRLDPGSGEVQRLRHDPHDPRSLPGNLVRALHRDAQGQLWVGTHSGLARLDAGDSEGAGFTRFQPPGRDFDNTVYGILEDARGHLWLSTNRGVLAFDPDSGQFRSFGMRDGLQGLEFNGGAQLARRDGRLAFGGTHGLTQFLPQRVLDDDYQPPVRITSVRVGAQRAERVRGLPPPRLAIGHGDRVVSFGFAALDYAAPERNLYAWRMHGFDGEWNEASARREATYTNLPPGLYRLEVRTSGRDGRWSPETASIELVVDPPWWSSLPMRAAYAALLALALIVLWRQARRRRKVRQLYAAQLREREDRLKLALWGSGDELWDLDLRTHTLRRVNPLPHMRVGAESEIGDARTMTATVHPDDVDEVDNAMRAVVRGSRDHVDVTYRAEGLDGNWHWLRTRGRVVLRDRSGRVLRLAGTVGDVSQLQEQQIALAQINRELEKRVIERTQALTATNAELESTLAALTRTQHQLVEQEKMAALGSLVAGIAHEINTPLGIGVTAASHLEAASQDMQGKLTGGHLTRAELDNYTRLALDGAQLILRNLQRADKLVKSFKQVAVDQASDERRRIDLAQYLDEIVTSLQPTLRRAKHRVEVDVNGAVILDTLPGAIYQSIANLVQNSVLHGFGERSDGLIRIEARRDGAECVIDYRDDGAGMAEDVRRRVFEPFYTTRRGQGGSGLGMHIVYNLVTQALRGSIHCESSPGRGARFVLRFPAILPLERRASETSDEVRG
jgi:ligand-binding sensor domain-containing protein/signal transduction histidine kinase